MTKVQGEREQRLKQGPGVTSRLGGRGDLPLGPPLGLDLAGKMRLRISNKQANNKIWYSSMLYQKSIDFWYR